MGCASRARAWGCAAAWTASFAICPWLRRFGRAVDSFGTSLLVFDLVNVIAIVIVIIGARQER